MKLLAHSPKDIIPVVAAVAHFSYVVMLFLIFPFAPWWVMAPLGLIYSISISWNINGIAHNFIHNPYFKSGFLNRIFSWMLSVTMGYSQQFYELVHNRHHMGNSDRKDEKGETIDWLSIYRHSHDDEPENPWTYVFCGYFRDDPKLIYRELKRRNPSDARFGVFEIVSWVSLCILGFILNWKYMLCFYIPFYYFGHCLSYLNGYFLHYGSNPDLPIAWGVSSYDKWYNIIWFNNGYHAEHHFRPKMHWTRMRELHEQIKDKQREAGVRVIAPPHAFGFLDKSLPKRGIKNTEPAVPSSSGLDGVS